MRLHRYLLAATIAAASLSSPVQAQSAATVSGVGAPIATRATVGVRRAANTPAPAPSPAPFRSDTRQNRAMMIVGGAALLTGAVVGGSAGGLIMVGGAVVGLWGLFQYMQ